MLMMGFQSTLQQVIEYILEIYWTHTEVQLDSYHTWHVINTINKVRIINFFVLIFFFKKCSNLRIALVLAGFGVKQLPADGSAGTLVSILLAVLICNLNCFSLHIVVVASSERNFATHLKPTSAPQFPVIHSISDLISDVSVVIHFCSVRVSCQCSFYMLDVGGRAHRGAESLDDNSVKQTAENHRNAGF